MSYELYSMSLAIYTIRIKRKYPPIIGSQCYTDR
jgi:hypothetical protein